MECVAGESCCTLLLCGCGGAKGRCEGVAASVACCMCCCCCCGGWGWDEEEERSLVAWALKDVLVPWEGGGVGLEGVALEGCSRESR